MIAVLYLVSVLVSLVGLAVTVRPRRAPAPTPPVAPAPAATAPDGDEVHVILAAVAKLAARLDKAA